MAPNERAVCSQPLLPERHDSLFDSEAGSDVTFLVSRESEPWRFPGHRDVLSKANPVFRAMLQGPLASESTIKIDDVEGRAFHHLLGYLYREEVHLKSVATALDTLYAANKYMCYGLVCICVSHIDQHLDHTNVLDVYCDMRVYCNSRLCEQAVVVPSAPPMEDCDITPVYVCDTGSNSPASDRNDSSIKTSSVSVNTAIEYCNALLHNCLVYIDLNADKVFTQERIEDLDLDSLLSLAERDTLYISSEAILFSALDKWCNRACKKGRLEMSAENRRMVLGVRGRYSPRYLLMSAEEFIAGPVPSELLDQAEITVLLSKILCHPERSHPAPQELMKVLDKMAEPRRQTDVDFVKIIPNAVPHVPQYVCDENCPGRYSLSKKKFSKKLKKKERLTTEDDPNSQKQSTSSCILDYLFRILACVCD